VAWTVRAGRDRFENGIKGVVRRLYRLRPRPTRA